MTPPKPMVLVVDDESLYRSLMDRELTERGYSVTTAADAEEAIQKIELSEFQAAICDVNLPRLQGIDLLEVLKNKNPHLEVIMMTGYGTVEDAVLSMKKGASNFIQKPFDFDQLDAQLQKALERSELKTILSIYDVSKAVFSSIKLETLIPMIMKMAVTLLKGDDASLMLKEDDGTIVLVDSIGLDGDPRRKSRLQLGERVAGKANLWKGPIVISGSIEDDPRFSGVTALREIHSAIVYPLTVKEELVGVLNVNRTVQTQPFSSTDLLNLTIFGSQIAQALVNAKIHSKLEQKVVELDSSYKRLQEAQEQLIQSEKLAAIGQLAAGVAHELNNPLMAIMGLCDLVLETGVFKDQERQDIETIGKQAIQCRDIVQNLLLISRKKEPRKMPSAIVPLIDDVLYLARNELKNLNISVEKDFPSKLPPVFVDPNQIQQVFLNLLTNAMHALESADIRRITIRVQSKPAFVLVSFGDTGCGIPPGNLKKIFEPFFTTKPAGKGNGLGLSVSHEIIAQNGGSIDVQSTEGKGTIFKIKFPLGNSGDARPVKKDDAGKGQKPYGVGA